MSLKFKHIYIVGILVFLLAFFKYLIYDVSALKIGFFVIDLLLLLGVIVIVYIALKDTNRLSDLFNDAENRLKKAIESKEKEISLLKSQLDNYEAIEAENEIYQSNKVKLTAQIHEKIQKFEDAKLLVNEIIDLLKTNFEIWALIGYVSATETGCYDAIVKYGIDEELEINTVTSGEGVHGQAIFDNKPVVLSDIPKEYFNVESATGHAKPRFVYFLPLMLDEHRKFLFEIATLKNERIEEIWRELLVKLNGE